MKVVLLAGGLMFRDRHYFAPSPKNILPEFENKEKRVVFFLICTNKGY